jgi:pimeloyl-ACP methyl ester carboxylesterase
MNPKVFPLTSFRLERIAKSVVCGLAVILAVACNNSTTTTPTPALTWTTCPKTPVNLNGSETDAWLGATSCSNRAVPLLWDTTGGKTINLFTAKFVATGTHRGSAIMLDGGPGLTGSGFAQNPMTGKSLYVALQDDGWDLVVPSHRGSGYSTDLICAKGADLKTCGAALSTTWGAGLRGFGPNDAALDVCDLSKALRKDGETRVVLYGSSYGTFLAQAALAKCPEVINALMLDGVMPPPSKLNFDQVPLTVEDDLAKRVVAGCTADATCTAALGGNPRSAVDAFLAKAAKGTLCPVIKSDLDAWKAFLINTISNGPAFLPAVIARGTRCNQADSTVLQTFIDLTNKYSSADNVPEAAYSKGLEYSGYCLMMKAYSSLSGTQIAALEDQALLSARTISDWVKRCGDWPITQYAKLVSPDPGVPVLVLEGEYDPITPLPWAKLAATSYAKSTLAVIPSGRHIVWGVSDCVPTIAKTFLAGAADLSCIKTLPPVDFSGTSAELKEASKRIFGTENLYGTP